MNLNSLRVYNLISIFENKYKINPEYIENRKRNWYSSNMIISEAVISLDLSSPEMLDKIQEIERNFKQLQSYVNYAKNHKDYFSDKDEIMAYAWSVVEELRFQGWNNNKIKQSLTNNFSEIRKNSKFFDFYFSEVKNHNQKGFKLLIKYMYDYLFGDFTKNVVSGNIK